MCGGGTHNFPTRKVCVANRSDEGSPRFHARSGTASNQCHCQKYASAEGDTPAPFNLLGGGGCKWRLLLSQTLLGTRCRRDHAQTMQRTEVQRLEQEHAGARGVPRAPGSELKEIVHQS